MDACGRLWREDFRVTRELDAAIAGSAIVRLSGIEILHLGLALVRIFPPWEWFHVEAAVVEMNRVYPQIAGNEPLYLDILAVAGFFRRKKLRNTHGTHVKVYTTTGADEDAKNARTVAPFIDWTSFEAVAMPVRPARPPAPPKPMTEAEQALYDARRGNPNSSKNLKARQWVGPAAEIKFKTREPSSGSLLDTMKRSKGARDGEPDR